MSSNRKKSLFDLIAFFILMFIFCFSFYKFFNKKDITYRNQLDLKNGDSLLIDSGIYLYDKDRQHDIIQDLYGDDLDTPSYFHLKDYIEINTSESQKNLGICSIFSVLKAIETNISLVESKNYNFSERYVDYMMSKDFFGDRNVGKIDGEMGDAASFSDIIQYIDDYGLVLEENVPYRDYNESEYDLIKNAKRIKTIDQYVRFSSFDGDKFYWMEVLKKHITKYGGIVSHIHFYDDLYHNETFSFYNNGDSTHSDSDDSISNHAVVIVGWDDQYSRDNFVVKPERDGAFIVYNSWGNEFGNQGYFYVSYEDIDILSYLIAFISTVPYYEKQGYLKEVSVPAYEDILFEEKTSDEFEDLPVWYYAYVFDRNSDYSDIGEINFYSSPASIIDIYINSYDDDVNDLNKFVHVGSISIDNGYDYEKFRFLEPVSIYGNKFSVILKYKTGSHELFYHNIDNGNNIYVYQNDKWEIATRVPYFNLYGYKEINS